MVAWPSGATVHTVVAAMRQSDTGGQVSTKPARISWHATIPSAMRVFQVFSSLNAEYPTGEIGKEELSFVESRLAVGWFGAFRLARPEPRASCCVHHLYIDLLAALMCVDG